MDVAKMAESDEVTDLLRRAAAGAEEPLRALFSRYRDRMRRMVALRMDRWLPWRIDPSDVIPEAQIEAITRLPEYLREPNPPSFLWLRGIAGNKLRELHRHHLGAQLRDPRREVPIHGAAPSETTTTAMAAEPLGDLTRASEEAVRWELNARLQDALDAMDPLDREVLVLRHCEELTHAAVARARQLPESAASKRYIRAVHRLTAILASLAGGLAEFRP
jgi:RNA polymerase sigma-70 factor (ECF subfamily)